MEPAPAVTAAVEVGLGRDCPCWAQGLLGNPMCTSKRPRTHVVRTRCLTRTRQRRRRVGRNARRPCANPGFRPRRAKRATTAIAAMTTSTTMAISSEVELAGEADES